MYSANLPQAIVPDFYILPEDIENYQKYCEDRQRPPAVVYHGRTNSLKHEGQK
jgi:hypothetical protein